MFIRSDKPRPDTLFESESLLVRERLALFATRATWGQAIDQFEGQELGLLLASQEAKQMTTAIGAALSLARELPTDELFVDRRWMNSDAPVSEEMSRNMERVMRMSMVAAISGMAVDSEFGAQVLRLGLGSGPEISPARRVVLGLPLDDSDRLGRSLDRPGPVQPFGPEPDPRIPPEWLDRLDDVLKAGALKDLAGGLSRVGLAIQAAPRPQPKPGARIDRFEPPRACVGNGPAEVVLVGVGFGNQRNGDLVFAGERELEVVDNEWTDTRIRVRIPPDLVGSLCLSVLENVGTASADALATLHDATIDLDTIIEGRFRWQHRPIASGLIALYTPRSVCGANNRLWVGPPRIERLQVGGVSAPGPCDWRTMTALPVSWVVQGASAIEWKLLPPPGAMVSELPDIGALHATPTSGHGSLPPAPRNRPWSGRLILRALNECGAVESTCQIRVTSRRGFVAVGGGSRSVFHVGVLAYLQAHVEPRFHATAGSGLGSLAAVQAAVATDPAPLSAFWESLCSRPVDVDGTVLLYERNAELERAFAQFKSGAYRGLVQATRAFAEQVHLRGWRGDVTWSIPSLVGKSGSAAEKILLASLNKGLPYALKLAAKILKTAGVKSVDDATGLIVDSFRERSLERKSQVEQFASDADLAMTATVFALTKLNPIAGAAVSLLVQVGIAIAKEIEKADQLARFRAVMDSGSVASYDGMHACLDSWLQSIGIAPAGHRALGHPVRLSVSMLESAAIGYIDETARVIATPDAPQRDVTSMPMSWGAALRAAIAMPGLTPLVQAATGGEASSTITLADGAIGDPSAVEAVIAAGADELIVSVPVPVDLPGSSSLAGDNFATLMRRAAQIREGRQSTLPLDCFRAWRSAPGHDTEVGDYLARLRVVDATIDIPFIDSLELDPGLMDIWRDYGYMRAFDTLAPDLVHPGDGGPPDERLISKRLQLSSSLDESSSLITALRFAAWELEHALSGLRFRQDRDAPIQNLLNSEEWLASALALRSLKRQIADRVHDRLATVRAAYVAAGMGRRWPGPAVPNSAQAWVVSFERKCARNLLTNGNGDTPSSPFERLELRNPGVTDDPRSRYAPIGQLEDASPPSIDLRLLGPSP